MRPQRERLPWVKQVDLPLRIPLHLVSDMEISSRGAEDALCPPARPAGDCTTEGLFRQRSATCSRQRALGQLRQTSGRVVPLPETPTSPPDQPSSYLALGPCACRLRSEPNRFHHGVVRSASTDHTPGIWDSLLHALVDVVASLLGGCFFSCRVSLVVSLLWTPVARTPQAGPRPLSLGGSTSAHPLAFHALFCPLVSCVIAICSSLGQKLFSRMFFARLPLQQDCNLNQRSSNVIKKLLHKWELQPQWM